MLSFIINRLLWMIPVVIVVAAVTFFLMYRAPGGPWDREKPLPQTTIDQLNRKFSLDKPTWLDTVALADAWDDGERNPIELGHALLDTQFFNYLANVFRGDLGPTYASRGTESVQSVIVNKFPVSLKIGVVAVLFAIIIGIPLGVAAALRQNSPVDYVCMFASTLGVAVPTFVSGLLLLIFMSRLFHISPIRRPDEWQGIFSTAYILPGIVLGLGHNGLCHASDAGQRAGDQAAGLRAHRPRQGPRGPDSYPPPHPAQCAIAGGDDSRSGRCRPDHGLDHYRNDLWRSRDSEVRSSPRLASGTIRRSSASPSFTHC